ncbi:MAG: hypothetical protein ACP5N1_00775 [Candidatus Woesearchaeota archaeon]
MLIKNNKKGQMALEFMATYGWALFAVMIAIAGLAYFMPDRDSLTVNKCIFGPATPCLGTKLSPENLTIVLRNGVGQTIYNVTANMTIPPNNNCAVSNTTLRVEETITIVCDNSITKIGPESKIKMIITYKKVKDGYNQVSQGDIYAK